MTFNSEAIVPTGGELSGSQVILGDGKFLIGECISDFAKLGDWVILEKLWGQLLSLREMKFSFQEISVYLFRSDIVISPDIIEKYFYQQQINHVLTCQQLNANCHNGECNCSIDRSVYLAVGLRQALKNPCGLVLHYQPQVDMLTGNVIGAEALLRWNFKGKMIDPSELISVAEQTGLIGPIGEWVLREACGEAKRWQSLGLGGKRGIKMAVNLSVKQFSTNLPGMINRILYDVGLPINLLGLEITESFLVGSDAYEILQMLHNSGLFLSIDDFGTGYSCLSKLKDLPITTIKIDRSFMADIELGGRSFVVVEAIIDLAKKLKMEVLAEGVATVEQAAILAKIGCTVGQGFLYSKALVGEEFVEFVGKTEMRVGALKS